MDVSKPDAITDFDGGHIRPDLRDNADALVAERNAELQRMFIRAAEARVSDFDDRVVAAEFSARLRLGHRAVLRPAVNNELDCHLRARKSQGPESI